MIKALLLIFEPVMTWTKIAQAKWKTSSVLLLYLLPLLVLTLAGELAALQYFGKAQEYLGKPQEFGGKLRVTGNWLIAYGGAQFITSLLLVAVSARLMKALVHTFNTRQTYTQCFTVTAYAFGPLFLLRLCDILPAMNPWASFGIGMVLTVATLYHGIPAVLEPDPPHAFGLYLCSLLLLACLGALGRYLTLLVLAQKIQM
jgi:hypothetical protein